MKRRIQRHQNHPILSFHAPSRAETRSPTRGPRTRAVRRVSDLPPRAPTRQRASRAPNPYADVSMTSSDDVSMTSPARVFHAPRVARQRVSPTRAWSTRSPPSFFSQSPFFLSSIVVPPYCALSSFSVHSTQHTDNTNIYIYYIYIYLDLLNYEFNCKNFKNS